MTKKLSGSLVATLLASGACGSSSNPCSALQSAYNALNVSAAACQGDAGAFVTFNPTACNNVFNGSACGAADVTAYSNRATEAQTCIQNAATCSPATASTWSTATENCLGGGDAGGPSAACLNAVNDGGVVTCNGCQP